MIDGARPSYSRQLAGGVILVAVAVLLGSLVATAPASSGAEPAIARRLSPVSALAKGKFLVAHRGLPDPNFARSVVLLIEYGDQGAMGLIVNRPTQVKLSQLWPEIKKIAERPDTFYVGGPVAPSHMLLLVRGEKSEDAHPVLDDLFMSSDREWLEEMIGGGFPEERLHVYSGHAGWAPGQLEREVERGDWFIWTADSDTVFSDEPGEEIWARLLSHTASVLAQVRTTEPREPVG